MVSAFLVSVFLVATFLATGFFTAFTVFLTTGFSLATTTFLGTAGAGFLICSGFIKVLSFIVKFDFWREAVFLGKMPLLTDLSKIEIESLKYLLVSSLFFSERARLNFLMVLFIFYL